MSLKKYFTAYSRLGKDARLLLISSTISGVSWGLYGSVWQLFLKHAGYGGTVIGYYSFLQGITTTVLIFPFGMLADRVSRKKQTIAGSIIGSLSTLIILMSTSLSLITVSALLNGISGAIVAPAWNALFAETIEDTGMEAGYGLSAFLGNIAMALGSLLGWVPELIVRYSSLGYFGAYRFSLLFPFSMGFVSLVPIILVRERFRPVSRPIFKFKAGTIAAKFSLVNAIVGFGAGLSIPLLPYFFSVKFGVESGPIGTLYAISSVIGAPAFLASAPLAQKTGIIKGILIPSGVSIPLLILIPLSPSFYVAASLHIPRTILMNMSHPLISALLMRLSPEDERASITSITHLARSLPNSFSQQIGGYIMENVGLDIPLFLTSGVYLIYIATFYMLFRNAEEEHGIKVEL